MTPLAHDRAHDRGGPGVRSGGTGRGSCADSGAPRPGHPVALSGGAGRRSAAWLDHAPPEALLALAEHATERAQRVPTPRCGFDLTTLDLLVERTRHRGDPTTHGRVLAAALHARLAVAGAGPAARAEPGTTDDTVEPLLAELLELVGDHDVAGLRVEVQALCARRALLADDEETALAAMTTALSHLDDPPPFRRPGLDDPRASLDDPSAGRRRDDGEAPDGVLRRSYRLVSWTLTSLGMHEQAQQLVERALEGATRGHDGRETARARYEAVRVATSWGMRMQRAGRDGSRQFRMAAHHARLLSRPSGRLPGDHRPLLRAAVALDRHATGRPGDTRARHLAIQDALALEARPCASLADHLLRELARARSLQRSGRTDAAVEALEVVLRERPRGEPDLLLAVHRERARLRDRYGAGHEEDGGPGDGSDATPSLRAYSSELEAELWALRRARVHSLQTRVAHERLRREHGEVAAQAFTDPLTGLPNRRALDATLSRLASVSPETQAQGYRVAVAMADVDHFKRINDTTSHGRGDEILRAVADTLRRCLRADDVVARYGGDEFVAVLPWCSAEDAATALRRAVAELSALPAGDGATVSLSVGIAEMVPSGGGPEAHGERPGAGGEARDVLARADAAMYTGKRAGGGTVALALSRDPLPSTALLSLSTVPPPPRADGIAEPATARGRDGATPRGRDAAVPRGRDAAVPRGADGHPPSAPAGHPPSAPAGLPLPRAAGDVRDGLARLGDETPPPTRPGTPGTRP